MYPLHDHNLDRLSREAADQFEVELEPGASGWDRLEKTLDQELPRKKDRKRFLFWLFFIAIGTGSALTALLHYTHTATSLSQNAIPVTATPLNNDITPGSAGNGAATGSGQPATTAAPAQHNNSAAANTTTDRTTQPAAGRLPHTADAVASTTPSQTPGSKPATAGIDATAQPHTLTGTTIAVNKTGAANTQTGISNNNNIAAATPVTIGKHRRASNAIALTGSRQPAGKTGGRKPVNRQQQDKQPSTGNISDRTADITGSNQVQHTNEATTGKSETTAGNDVETTPATGVPGETSATGTNSQAAQNKTAAAAGNPVAPVTGTAADSLSSTKQPAAKKEKKTTPVQHWELGLTGGPDASAVSFGPLYKTGFNVGLQLGYRINNRWQVNTGAIYTKKFYKADSQYYHPKYYVPPTWPINRVEGNCSMWEIPVNIRYDISYNEKRRWFASTGLSTYLMTEEKYDIYYGRNGTPYPANNPNGSQYVFSILNVSLGMERTLGKHLSFQAEPYLKVPLKGLGMGSMRINSYGMYFTLKYKPTFGKKQAGNTN